MKSTDDDDLKSSNGDDLKLPDGDDLKSPDDDFKQPEFILICSTSDCNGNYRVLLEIYTSASDDQLSAINNYLKFLINDSDFINSILLGHKWYFYNTHDNALVKRICSTNTRTTINSNNTTMCLIQ